MKPLCEGWLSHSLELQLHALDGDELRSITRMKAESACTT